MASDKINEEKGCFYGKFQLHVTRRAEDWEQYRISRNKVVKLRKRREIWQTVRYINVVKITKTS